MIAYHVKDLKSAEKLVNTCNKYDFDIDAVHGVQTINAKSLLGVTSLLGKFISLNPITDDKDALFRLENDIKAIW